MIFIDILSIVVSVWLIYKLSNQKKEIHVHLTTVVDHSGKVTNHLNKDFQEVIKELPDVEIVPKTTTLTPNSSNTD